MAALNNHPRRRGSYAPLSAHYYLDDALVQAGEAAELLYVRGLAFCAATLSDGWISDAQLTRGPGAGMANAKKRAAKLVEVGAWVRERGGWRVRSWLRWNMARDDILAQAEADRQRKARGGRANHAPAASERTTQQPTGSDRNPDGNQAEPDRNPPVISEDSGTTRARYPDPHHSSSSSSSRSGGHSGEGGSPAERASSGPHHHCPEHEHLGADEPGPNCPGCRDVRLRAEKAADEAAHAREQAQADEAAARALALAACRRCDENGMTDTGGGALRRCDHTEAARTAREAVRR